jgi:endoglycosylceramidase
MGEKFCGDGIPNWLADKLHLYNNFPFPMGSKIPLNESGLPSWDKCDKDGWGKYYFSYDVGRAFAQLYKHGSPLNVKFTQFWLKIATRFRNNPYVIGYELINEPFVGNAIRNLGLVIPSIAERAKFQVFYDNLVE